MVKQKKQCRVCGREYEACRSARTGGAAFNWREVACSPECGAEYFRQVETARHTAAVPDSTSEPESVGFDSHSELEVLDAPKEVEAEEPDTDPAMSEPTVRWPEPVDD